MATNYTGVDLDRYNAGNKFLSQDPYLQNYQNKSAITFNPSNYDTGITSQYGNNSMYGTPANTGGSGGGSGGGINFGNFNQKDNLFEIGPNTNMQPNVYDEFGKDGQVYNTSLGQRAKDLAGKARDYGMKGFASQMLSQGGGQAGYGIMGLPGAVIGMLGGAKLGFGARGPTDAERVTGNFYGNQGNSPTQYLDPNTGQLVNSEMQGYNISSAFGKGITGTLEDRLATIDDILSKREEEEEKTGIYKGLDKMHKNSLYQKRSRLNQELAAMNLNEQQQMDNMKSQEVSVFCLLYTSPSPRD